MRSFVLSLALLSFVLTGFLHSRPVDLSIPAGGHGPIDSNGFVQHWIELTEIDFGGGLALPMRMTLQSILTGNHGFGEGLWMSPLLDSKIVNRSTSQMRVLLPCGKVLSLVAQNDQKNSFTTPDGEWIGVVKATRTLVSREDGWEMEFDKRGLLLRLRTDTGRTVLWNRLADGTVRTINEVAQNSIVATGLTVTLDPVSKTITALDARTAAGEQSWQLGYVDAGKRLAAITFPDRTAERFDYTYDTAGNPGITIHNRSQVDIPLVWRKNTKTLISDGLWTYDFKMTKGDIYPVTIRVGPGGETEIFHDDFKNRRSLFTSADGALTIRQNVTTAGAAQGKVVSITRQLAGAKEPATIYQAAYNSATGMMTEEKNALGDKTKHAYEFHGATPHSGIKRHMIIDPLGHKTITEFDRHGNLLTTSNALGHTTHHEYDAQNRRIKTIGPDGVVVEALTYNEQGKVKSRSNALGAVTKYDYDKRGNQISITDALGQTTRHTYDDRGNRTSTTDALGNTTRYEYDAGKRLIASILPELEKDPQASNGQNKKATRYVYNNKGLNVRTIAHDGTVTNITSYDAFGRTVAETNALGHTTKYEYDLKKGAIGCNVCSHTAQPTRIISPCGRITERTYDADQHLLTEAIAAGTPQEATTTNTFDLAGHILSTTDPLGRTTTFKYDAAGNRINVIFPDKTNRSYAHDALRQLTTETNELGHSTKRVYDAYGNLITFIDPEGHMTQALFGSGDDSSIRRKGHAALHLPTMTVSAAGIHTRIEYDSIGRCIVVTKAPGTPLESSTRHEYDVVGNEIATITNIGAATGQAHGEQRTVHTYDACKRRITTSDGLNRTWHFVYSDNVNPAGPDSTSKPDVIAIIHPDGTRDEKVYNALGQLIEIRDANITIANDQSHGGNSEPKAGIRHAYDPDGRLAELTDGNGHTTKWRYDARGKLIAKTYPDGSTELYEHDAAGQISGRVRPDGTSVRYAYDLRGRLLRIEWSDGKTESSFFAYDAAGHMILAENKNSKIQRTYNDAGRMAKEIQQINPLFQNASDGQQSEQPFFAEVGYTYTADGKLSLLTYPDQTTVSYAYNERGELASVHDFGLGQKLGTNSQEFQYQRRPDGKIISLAMPNATINHRTFDQVGRLSEIKHLSPDQSILYSETNRYDQRNRPVARIQTDGSTDLFAYDPAGQVTAAAYGQAAGASQLTSASGENSTVSFKPIQTFAYDSSGNRLEVSDKGLITKYQSNAVNQYTQIESTISGQSTIREPSFDLSGNLLCDDQNTYTWDGDIHLLSITKKSEVQPGIENRESRTDFRYDALHRRISRHEGNTTILFIMDGWNVISEFVTSPSLPLSKSPTLRLIWGEDLSGTLQGAGGIGGLLACSWSTPSPVRHACFHFDSNGNVIALTDAAGKQSAQYRYDAFGKTIMAKGPLADINRYQFSTKPIERGSGLAFYGYRYYSPELGRWPSKDPIGELGGMNLYGMVRNGPVYRVDLLGWEEVEVDDIMDMTGEAQIDLEVQMNVDVSIDWDAETVTVRNAVPTGDVGKSWNVIIGPTTIKVTTSAGALPKAWVTGTPKFSTQYVGSELRQSVEYKLAGSMQLTVTIENQSELEFEIPVIGTGFSVGGGSSETKAVKPDNNGQKFSHSRPVSNSCPTP